MEGQFQLALLYIQGLGVEENRYEAKMWLRRAADAGHPHAGGLLKDMRREDEDIW